MEKGLVQVYTGDGKGKTTAAIGLAARALGNGMKVKILQFLKSEKSGEIIPLENLGAEIVLCNHQEKPTWTMNESEEQILKKDSVDGWKLFVELLDGKEYDIIILDEVNHALSRGYINKDEALNMLDRDLKTEIVFTGRNAPDWLVERADLVTEMQMIKHPYEQGIGSRKGIEK